ncbi:MAG: pyridoxamine 5'-phosphate oxidase family protein, partial [Bryobacteraceae bacterium]
MSCSERLLFKQPEPGTRYSMWKPDQSCYHAHMTAFRKIRHSDRALSEDEAREILARADHGVLATLGPDGWPYAVPLNHVLFRDVLYVHCAVEGHKLENIAHEERVSFCAVANARVLPAKLTTLYESAIAFGRASLVTDPVEKR